MNTDYIRHHNEFQNTLKPEGILEQTFAHEIAAAAWRLNRYRQTEAESTLTDDRQKSIDRSRAAATLALRRSIAELRRLQTERQIRQQLLPADTDQSHSGLAEIKQIIAAQKSAPQLGSFFRAPQPAPASETTPQPALASFCKTAETAANAPASPLALFFPGTPRTALCPCNSGRKYKKCHGVDAPPVLGKVA